MEIITKKNFFTEIRERQKNQKMDVEKNTKIEKTKCRSKYKKMFLIKILIKIIFLERNLIFQSLRGS